MLACAEDAKTPSVATLVLRGRLGERFWVRSERAVSGGERGLVASKGFWHANGHALPSQAVETWSRDPFLL